MAIKQTTFELRIKCNACCESNVRTGPLGYHCGSCGSFDLNFSGDEVKPSGKRKPL
jgi:hypothetical protein